MTLNKYCSIFFFLLYCTCMSQSGKILFVPAHLAMSHVKSMMPLANTLVKHGHQVTMLQVTTERTVVRTIDEMENIALDIELSQNNSLDHSKYVIWTPAAVGPEMLSYVFQMMTGLCHSLFDPSKEGTVIVNGTVQNGSSIHQTFLDTINKIWDLVIVDSIFAPCGIHAALKNGRYVDYSTTTLYWSTLKGKVIVPPLALNPSWHLAQYNSALFMDRLINFRYYLKWLPYFPWLESLAVPTIGDNPLTRILRQGTFFRESIFAIGSLSPILAFHQPKTNEILTADFECPKDEQLALPENYRQFIEDPSSKGTILLAMGHYFQTFGLPDHIYQALHNALLNLTDYRIVWQISAAKEGSSPHIMRSNWIPQAAILAHPKTVAFLTHMGYKSFREALCNRIPMVALPIFAEQFLNTAMCQRMGVATFLDKCSLTAESVERAVRSVVTEARYKQAARRLGDVLEDVIMSPTKEVEFWLSFYLRHPNIPDFLRQRGRNFYYFQLYSIDVILAGLCITLILVSCIER